MIMIKMLYAVRYVNMNQFWKSKVHSTDMEVLLLLMRFHYRYLPVAMARAWLCWKENDFAGAEREFRSSAEFCAETQSWRLHAAHVLFMRGDKYKEAVAFYEPIVRQNYDDVSMISVKH